MTGALRGFQGSSRFVDEAAVQVAQASLGDRLDRHRPFVGRYPFFYFSANARFESRSQQASALISSYRTNGPPEIGDIEWHAAIDVVQDAWSKAIAARGYIDEDELQNILSQMRALADRTNSYRSEGDCTRSWIYWGTSRQKCRAAIIFTRCELTSKRNCKARMGPAWA